MKNIIIVPLLLFVVNVFSQSRDIKLTCGETFESEFTVPKEEHDIKLNLEAGDVVEVELIPLGDYLNIAAKLFDPNDMELLKDLGTFGSNKRSFKIKSGVLSGNGIYTLKVTNWVRGNRSKGSDRAGVYSIYITCTKRGGEVIKP